jgi:SAM-dependent methyltransferase
MSGPEHWEGVYRSKGPSGVSWYQPHLARSLELIEGCGAAKDAGIVDVGGGASSLVDDLLDRGYSSLSVLDLAESALSLSKQRLGDRAGQVSWLCGDVTKVELPRAGFAVWHDRAVFHFLTDAGARAAYVRQVRRAVRSGGHVIVATFGPEGPEKCSGLPVVRYDAGALHDEFGEAFELMQHLEERHVTPWGSLQEFVYCWCVKQS